MAVTEIVFPALKPDKATIDEVERLWPTASKVFTDPNPGLLSASRGWMLSENGKDQRDAFREILILEWREASAFHNFVAGPAFGSFVGSIKHLCYGPPTLQLFDTTISPKEAGKSRLTEIIQVSMNDAESGVAAEEAWNSFPETTSAQGITYGKSSNPEKEVFMGLIGWGSIEEQAAAHSEEAFKGLLASLKAVGIVLQFLVDVSPMEFPER